MPYPFFCKNCFVQNKIFPKNILLRNDLGYETLHIERLMKASQGDMRDKSMIQPNLRGCPMNLICQLEQRRFWLKTNPCDTGMTYGGKDAAFGQSGLNLPCLNGL